MVKLTERIDLPDPKPALGDGKLPLNRYSGPGVVGGFDPEDVRQGALANCYVPSAFASMAQFMDRDLERAFKENGDGTYTVTFLKRLRDGKVEPHAYNVDADLYMRDDGQARYMKTEHDKITELWPALFEKALAIYESKQQKIDPTYRAIGNGGLASDVMSLLTGRKAYMRTITGETMLWREITSAVDRNCAVALGTFEDGRKYKGSGIIDDHSYSVLGYEVDEVGEKWVCLRNPWGDTEPKDNGPDDGEFWLPLSLCVKYFETFDTVL